MKLGGTQSDGIRILHQNFQNNAEENDKPRGVVNGFDFITADNGSPAVNTGKPGHR